MKDKKTSTTSSEPKKETVGVPAKDSKKKLYRVVFRENRTHECRVGLETIIWSPRGKNPIFPLKYKDGLPEEIINHHDFEPQKKYFVITEGK